MAITAPPGAQWGIMPGVHEYREDNHGGSMPGHHGGFPRAPHLEYGTPGMGFEGPNYHVPAGIPRGGDGGVPNPLAGTRMGHPTSAPPFGGAGGGSPAPSLPFAPAPIFPQMPQVPLMSQLPMRGGMVDFNSLAGLMAGPIPNMQPFFPESSPQAASGGMSSFTQQMMGPRVPLSPQHAGLLNPALRGGA